MVKCRDLNVCSSRVILVAYMRYFRTGDDFCLLNPKETTRSGQAKLKAPHACRTSFDARISAFLMDYRQNGDLRMVSTKAESFGQSTEPPEDGYSADISRQVRQVDSPGLCLSRLYDTFDNRTGDLTCPTPLLKV